VRVLKLLTLHMQGVENTHVSIIQFQRLEGIKRLRHGFHLGVPNSWSLNNHDILWLLLFPCLKYGLKTKTVTAMVGKHLSNLDFIRITGAHWMIQYNIVLTCNIAWLFAGLISAGNQRKQ